MKSSLIRNTGLNYLGQAYALLVGILILPFYLGHLGAEAYGLVGFFTVLQAWLQLLDAGLSPSLVRQIAHYRGATDAEALRLPGRLLRSFELLLLPIALVCGAGLYAGSDWIAEHWLQARTLELVTLERCLGLMGLMIALRLYATLYKSGLQGLELHGWLNGANMAIATLRYFGGLLLVAEVSQDPLHFFLFQTLVGLLETLLFAGKAYARMPLPRPFCGLDWPIVRPVLPFAAGLTVTTGLWILLTQLDKLLLSRVLLLETFGYFSLVALVSTGLLTLINPLVQTLLPRLTMLAAEGRTEDMHALYLGATRFVCSLLFPLAAMIAVHAESLILAWTGSAEAARWSEPILFWYALGSAILAASGFQFYLQYALGQLRLHLWYSVVSAVVTVPLMIWAAFTHGAHGVALTWFALRLAAHLLWPAVVHRRFAPGIHRRWLRDQALIASATALGLLISEPLVRAFGTADRLHTLLGLTLAGLLCLLPVILSTQPMRFKLSLPSHRPSP